MKVLERAGLNLVEMSGQRFIMSDEHVSKIKANVQKRINTQNRQIRTSSKPRQQKKGVAGLGKNNEAVPKMPVMKWKDGKPDYSDLEHISFTTRVNQAIPKEQYLVPAHPRMRWNRDGSPDWSHL